MQNFKFIVISICLITAACGTPSEIREISTNTTSALSELNKELGKAQKNAITANKRAAAMIGEMKAVESDLRILTDQEIQLGGVLNVGQGKAATQNEKLYEALVKFTALRQQELEATLQGTAPHVAQALSGLEDLKIPKNELQQIAAKLGELRKNDSAFNNLKSMFEYMKALSQEIKALQKASAAN